ncbi:MAG: hypothetical protein QXX35_00755 [Desulfurococcaceae archaeon]
MYIIVDLVKYTHKFGSFCSIKTIFVDGENYLLKTYLFPEKSFVKKYLSMYLKIFFVKKLVAKILGVKSFSSKYVNYLYLR